MNHHDIQKYVCLRPRAFPQLGNVPHTQRRKEARPRLVGVRLRLAGAGALEQASFARRVCVLDAGALQGVVTDRVSGGDAGGDGRRAAGSLQAAAADVGACTCEVHLRRGARALRSTPLCAVPFCGGWCV